jgi:hypothetical protein
LSIAVKKVQWLMLIAAFLEKERLLLKEMLFTGYNLP